MVSIKTQFFFIQIHAAMEYVFLIAVTHHLTIVTYNWCRWSVYLQNLLMHKRILHWTYIWNNWLDYVNLLFINYHWSYPVPDQFFNGFL